MLRVLRLKTNTPERAKEIIGYVKELRFHIKDVTTEWINAKTPGGNSAAMSVFINKVYDKYLKKASNGSYLTLNFGYYYESSPRDMKFNVKEFDVNSFFRDHWLIKQKKANGSELIVGRCRIDENPADVLKEIIARYGYVGNFYFEHVRCYESKSKDEYMIQFRRRINEFMIIYKSEL